MSDAGAIGQAERLIVVPQRPIRSGGIGRMLDTLPIAVVGAGVVGMAAARALQRAGKSVVVLDPNGPGTGCSKGNAGYIAPELVMPMAQPGVIARLPHMLANPLGPLTLKPARLIPTIPWMLRFALASFPSRTRSGTAALASLLRLAWPAWEDEIAASGLQRLFVSRGSLVVYERRQSLVEAAREGRVMSEYGVRFEDLSAADVLTQLPSLRVPIAGGRRFIDSTHVRDPLEVVEALADRFVADGGRIETAEHASLHSPTTSFDGIDTGSAVIKIAGVVLAAGADGASLAGQLGAHAPLTRERLPCHGPQHRSPARIASRLRPRIHCDADGDGNTACRNGGAWRRRKARLAARRDAADMRALFGNPDLTPISRWFGNRPSLPDYLPMIDRAPRARNAVLALGHHHVGLTLAAITGRLVADLHLNRVPPVDMTPFRAARFDWH